MKRLFGQMLSVTMFIMGLLACGSDVSAAQVAHHTLLGRPSVSSPDLLRAGFPKTTRLTSTQDFFLAPTTYFQTDGGYLTILIQPISDPTWAYNNNQSEVLAMGHQVQVRQSRPGSYIVVTGPDVNRVSALANILKKK